MTQLYEGMFLLDNQVVREDWNAAKALVTGTLEKHGAKVLTARLWDERKLAYSVRARRRATYLLAYYEAPAEALPSIRREFDLSENVLRYLGLRVDALPEGEAEKAEAENAADFQPPTPPPDDAPDVRAEEAGNDESGSGEYQASSREGSDDARKDEDGTDEGETAAKESGAEGDEPATPADPEAQKREPAGSQEG